MPPTDPKSRRRDRRFKFLLAVTFPFRFLPLKLARLLGTYSGRVIYFLPSRARHVCVENLKYALGMDQPQSQRTARLVFADMGRRVMETLVALGQPARLHSSIDTAALDQAQSYYQKHGNFIGVTGHFGHWELLGSVVGQALGSMSVIGKDASTATQTDFLLQLRKHFGMVCLPQDSDIRTLCRLVKEGQPLGLLPDQDIPRLPGAFLSFFERPCLTPVGPGVLAYLSKAPLIPMFMLWEKTGYRVVIGDPIWPDMSKSRDQAAEEMMQAFNKVLEDIIRQNPTQWAWIHRRWRSTPESHQLSMQRKRLKIQQTED